MSRTPSERKLSSIVSLALPKTAAMHLAALLACVVFSSPVQAQVTRTWTGAVDARWSSAGNWNPVGAPVTGDALVFPATANRVVNQNDLPARLALTRLTFSGDNYRLSGNGIVLSEGIENSGTLNRLDLAMDVQSNAIFIRNSESSFRIGGALLGSGPIQIEGVPTGLSRTTHLAGAHAYAGTIIIDDSRCGPECGELNLVDASMVSTRITVVAGNYLTGSGRIGDLTSAGYEYPQTYDPVSGLFAAPGRLQTGNLAFGAGATYFDLAGVLPGISHDQISVEGSVALGATKSLTLSIEGGFAPGLGQAFVLIENDAGDAVTGTFAGYPEGAVISEAGFQFALSYVGGDGNDVTLTVVDGRPASSLVLATSGNPSNAGEAITFTATVTGGSGTATGSVVFRDGATLLATRTLDAGGTATLTTSTFAIGNHPVTAEYRGGAAQGGVASLPLLQRVVQVYTLTYGAGANGSISGVSPQSVGEGGSGSAVTAVPNAGYSFIQWSDGSTSNPRVDGNILGDLMVGAIFANRAPIIFAATASPAALDEAGASTIAVDADDPEGTTLTYAFDCDGNGVFELGPQAADSTTCAFAVPGNYSVGVRVADLLGVSSSASVLVTVTAVNDAPGLVLSALAAYPAASVGARSVVGFATFDAGPDDEDATQVVDDYLIDGLQDPDGVLVPGSLDVTNDGILSFQLTGVGGTATANVRVRDSGASGGNHQNLSSAQPFALRVAPGADLQLLIDNGRTVLSDGETTLYEIVVANAGPNAVAGAVLTDPLPTTLLQGLWTCRPALSTAPCPQPDSDFGNLQVAIDLGVGQSLRFDVIAVVDGSVGALVSNRAQVQVPAGVTALVPGNDSATDEDVIVSVGIFADGYEPAPMKQ